MECYNVTLALNFILNAIFVIWIKLFIPVHYGSLKQLLQINALHYNFHMYDNKSNDR